MGIPLMKNITVNSHHFQVSFRYSPPEPATHDYPGCPEEWEFLEILKDGRDVSWVLDLGDSEVYWKFVDALKLALEDAFDADE